MAEENNNNENNGSLKDKTSRGSSLKEKTSRGSGSLKDKTSRGSSSLKDKTSRGSSLKDRTSRSSSSLKDRAKSSRKRGGSKKKPKKMIPYGIGVFVIVIIIGILLAQKSAMLAFYWITGIGFGFILQKARFCFTAALRDPNLTGSTSLTRAVLTAFAVTSIGFLAIQYGAHLKGLPIPGMSYVVPTSPATAIGAFMFGIGMVIAGGCASGTLMRVGEGFTMQALSLFFFVVGSLWGAHDFGWWKYHFMLKGKSVYFPDVFGWIGALVVQMLIIGVLYVIADKWENRKKA